jgi:hypothetical protein
MPGTNAGTGQPISFKCAVERRENLGLWGRIHHQVERTGRSKPYRRLGQGGMRTMRTAFEYRCSCGHVGWSAHIDILAEYIGGPRPAGDVE